MKNTLRTFFAILLTFILLFSQVVLVPNASASNGNPDANATVSVMNEVAVAQAVFAYFQCRAEFLTSGDMAAFTSAVPAMVRDEQLHFQSMEEQGFVYESYAIECVQIYCETLFANVTLNEIVTYRTNGPGVVGPIFTETVEHKIFVSMKADGQLIVASDEYHEAYSGFSSCSYVGDSESIAEPMAVGSSLCITEVARGEEGYVEGANNNNKYGAYFGNNYQPWCSMFVTWCARMCNISSTVIPYEPWVPTLRNHYDNLGRYYKSQSQNGTTAPAVGDLFFQGDSYDDVGHVGIIVAVNSTYITVVDGNSGSNTDRVVCRTISRTNSSFVGFARPNYGSTTHSISTTWNFDANTHWWACQNCGYEVNRAAHDFVQYGSLTRCSVCGYNPNISIDRILHPEAW